MVLRVLLIISYAMACVQSLILISLFWLCCYQWRSTAHLFSIDKKASSETASLAAILGISSLSAGTMLMCSVLYAEDTQILILSTDYVSVFVLVATPAPAKLSALIGLPSLLSLVFSISGQHQLDDFAKVNHAFDMYHHGLGTQRGEWEERTQNGGRVFRLLAVTLTLSSPHPPSLPFPPPFSLCPRAALLSA